MHYACPSFGLGGRPEHNRILFIVAKEVFLVLDTAAVSGSRNRRGEDENI